jgi:glycosyl transferase family 2
MLRKLFPSRFRRPLGRLRDAVISQVYAARALRRRKHRNEGRPHGLPGELVVSLTSYPARFDTLHLTLACLLDQTMKPDRTILWIAEGDMDKLPAKVRRLQDRGLEIRLCGDLRSYKKLIPALKAFPGAFIATADDDIYYPADWLETLVNGFEDGVIVCHRAHRIARFANGAIRPYEDWEVDVQDANARQPSTDILATSGAGALYPPGSLGPRVTDRLAFERLCADGDDLWFHWCARLNGTLQKKVGGKMNLVMWRGSQTSSLWEANARGGNDQMIAELEREFPETTKEAHR